MNAMGRFVWHELMTTDTAAAGTFYKEIAGWGGIPSGMPGYEMFTVGKEPLAGLMTLPEEARKHGAPPHWLGFVGVENVDATVERAQRLGGKVMVPGSDIPNIGRFAVLSDPQGAAFALFQAADTPMVPDSSARGQVGWSELNSTDWKGAWSFYSELFGWKTAGSIDMGPEFGTYQLLGVDPEAAFGGMSNAANMMNAPSHWLHYINVANADESAKLIQAKGGKVLNGPMDVPGDSRVAQCMDPQGAAFGIVSRAK